MPPVSPGNPERKGFLVEYEDGYESWSPDAARKYHIYMTYETQTELLDAIKKEAEE